MPNDPIADYMNTQGLQGLIGPNPYLQYTGQIPMAGYRGAPTDAQGNPIASFTAAQAAHDAWQPPAQPQGTTLNSSPQSGVDPAAQARAAMQARINPGPSAYYAPSSSGFTSNQYDNGRAPLTPFASAPVGPSQQPAAAAAPAAPTNPIDMRQAYLDALSNPGKVTTPGAQMLPGTSPTGPQSQPSVLSQFLAQHPGGGTTGGGGYNNTGFFNTLNALKQGGTS
jgi:hypothetical protein